MYLSKSTARLLPARIFSVLVFVCVSAVSSQTTAELKEMSDASLEKVVGKAGLTIDIETEISIAEFVYVDAGAIYFKDFSLTGIGGGLVDNLRATVDVAGPSELLGAGFSEMAMLADMGYLDATETDVAWAIAEYGDGFGNYGKQFDDGDLVIHVTSQDFGQDFTTAPVPGDQAANLVAAKNAIDLHIQQGDFGLRSSDGSVETSLTRNLSIEAYLGYLDILITNRGNGLTHTGRDPGLTGSDGRPANVYLADAYIGIDSKFRVEDMDVDSTNNVQNPTVPLSVKNPYLTLRDFRIHNERGLDTLGSFGYASVESKVGAVSGIINNNDVLKNGGNIYVDGQAIYDVNITWDWDLNHVSMGDDGVSIGSVYFTDFQIRDTSLVISAH